MNRRTFLKSLGASGVGLGLSAPLWGQTTMGSDPRKRPNIVLIMTDDQGWGETGYYEHPVLKTPSLDAMAANGLRFDRFYASGPVCSPTRASVLTGRTHNRTGVKDHGFALRHQEKTLSEALKDDGYATGHFGKWHLNGLRGPGIPILKEDEYGPAYFGFEDWVSVTNFFDLDPWMSDNGEARKFEGTSSEIIVAEALKFIRKSKESQKPFFAVIWDGSPHVPWKAKPEDTAAFSDLEPGSREHYGELVAFDRSVGQLRQGLRDLELADNTLVWFCSDNGGLPGVNPGTTGGLRGHKGSVWEGGIRVPCVIEWPAGIQPRVTSYPASTVDIFPTIVELLGLPKSVMLNPVDGLSLLGVFEKEIGKREKAIGFQYGSQAAWVDNEWKLAKGKGGGNNFSLHNLADDPVEANDLSQTEKEQSDAMKQALEGWIASVQASVAGKDYPEGSVKDTPERKSYNQDPRYQPYLKEWK